MASIDRPCNLADPVQRQVLFQGIRALTGWHRVTVEPMRRASPAARGYLHGLCIPMLADYLAETQGERFSDDEAWEWAKAQFRGREVVDRVTGEARVIGRSTADLGGLALFEFTEKVRAWLLDRGVDVPEPDKNWREAKARAQAEANQQRKAG